MNGEEEENEVDLAFIKEIKRKIQEKTEMTFSQVEKEYILAKLEILLEECSEAHFANDLRALNQKAACLHATIFQRCQEGIPVDPSREIKKLEKQLDEFRTKCRHFYTLCVFYFWKSPYFLNLATKPSQQLKIISYQQYFSKAIVYLDKLNTAFLERRHCIAQNIADNELSLSKAVVDEQLDEAAEINELLFSGKKNTLAHQKLICHTTLRFFCTKTPDKVVVEQKEKAQETQEENGEEITLSKSQTRLGV